MIDLICPSFGALVWIVAWTFSCSVLTLYHGIVVSQYLILDATRLPCKVITRFLVVIVVKKDFFCGSWSLTCCSRKVRFHMQSCYAVRVFTFDFRFVEKKPLMNSWLAMHFSSSCMTKKTKTIAEHRVLRCVLLYCWLAIKKAKTDFGLYW